ncbi:FAD:protein FMN transferase [Thermithiobacillus plumbiphilus]|uniref:FAD:protein FMN transferase n=1 Tax=Thermithiobacillus plumbiphilus TaxID=1729899 RepID=A0ABU9D8E0_9PROT
MGTLASISVHAPDNAQTQAALQSALKTLDTLNQTWHPWESGAALAQFNASIRGGNWVPVPAQLLPLLRTALRYHAESQGLFDPGLGALTALWGFKEAPDPGIQHPPPSLSAIEELLKKGVGIGHLQLRQDSSGAWMARSDSPALILDFGGLAKGYAVDVVIDELARYGIHDAVVNLGGNLRVAGSKGGEPWRIGIRAPRGDGVLAALRTAENMSVLTSGDYERYFIHRGTRYHHILDPRSGAPARGLISVTVVTPTGLRGELASKALFIAGPRDWPRMASRLGIDKALVVEENGQVWVTPAMKPLLEFAPGVRARVRALPLPPTDSGQAA